MLAGTQFLCFGEYLLYKGSNSYNINSCETIEVFYNIRTDFEKLQYASLITKIVYDVTNENENSYKILQLFLNTLYKISETEMNLELILSIFKIRLLSILGFRPHIDNCTNCKEEKNITHFSIRDNGFKCEACSKLDKSVVKISEGTLNAIKYIILSPPKKLYSFTLSDECIKELELVSKIYLNEKLEKEYKL